MCQRVTLPKKLNIFLHKKQVFHLQAKKTSKKSEEYFMDMRYGSMQINTAKNYTSQCKTCV